MVRPQQTSAFHGSVSEKKVCEWPKPSLPHPIAFNTPRCLLDFSWFECGLFQRQRYFFNLISFKRLRLNITNFLVWGVYSILSSNVIKKIDYLAWANWIVFRPWPHVSVFIWKRNFLFRFSKKFASTRYRIRIVFACPHVSVFILKRDIFLNSVFKKNLRPHGIVFLWFSPGTGSVTSAFSKSFVFLCPDENG